MSLAVLYRRRKFGSIDDGSALSIMGSLFDAALVFVEPDTDLEDDSHEEVETGECNGE